MYLSKVTYQIQLNLSWILVLSYTLVTDFTEIRQAIRQDVAIIKGHFRSIFVMLKNQDENYTDSLVDYMTVLTSFMIRNHTKAFSSYDIYAGSHAIGKVNNIQRVQITFPMCDTTMWLS